jgi:hypothetical protein
VRALLVNDSDTLASDCGVGWLSQRVLCRAEDIPACWIAIGCEKIGPVWASDPAGPVMLFGAMAAGWAGGFSPPSGMALVVVICEFAFRGLRDGTSVGVSARCPTLLLVVAPRPVGCGGA